MDSLDKATSVLFKINQILIQYLVPDGDDAEVTLGNLLELMDPWPLRNFVLVWYIADSKKNIRRVEKTYDEVYEEVGMLNEKYPCLAPFRVVAAGKPPKDFK